MGVARTILLGTRFRRAMTLLVFGVLLCMVTLELACQVVGYFVLRKLDATKSESNHYYQETDDDEIGYELRHDFSVTLEGRRLHINKLGYREDSDSTFADKTRVVVLGDSVTFGTGLSQDETVPWTLQQLLDPEVQRIKVFNCGMAGLGLGQFPAYLKKAEGAYSPQAVVYLFNPNDFALRNSSYEGADSGLYRTYHHPLLKAPWMIRKVIYRLKKGGDMVLPSTRWYRWLFDGTQGVNLPRILKMKQMCDARKEKFVVALMPTCATFSSDDKTMPQEYAEIEAYLKQNGIEYFDSTEAFRAAGGFQGLIDNTDHFTPQGCKVMAGALKPVVENLTK